MSHKRFDVHILEEFCKGCGLCIGFCEQGKIYIRSKPNKEGIQTAAVREDMDCSGCMRCATICPDAAVEIRRVDVPVVETSEGSD